MNNSTQFKPCAWFSLLLIFQLFFWGNAKAQVCNILGDTTVCENEVVPYSTTNTGSGYTYQWNAFGGVSVGSGPSITVTWNSPGSGQVTLIVRDSANQIVCI